MFIQKALTSRVNKEQIFIFNKSIMKTHINVYIHIHIHIYVYIYVHVYICVYFYT